MTIAAAIACFFITATQGLSDDFEKVVGQLSDPDEEVRAAACKALGASGDEKAVSALEKKLRDSSPTVQSEAADALVRISGPAVEKVFEKFTQSENSDYRQIGVAGLAKVGTSEATADLLMSKLADSSSRVRWSAALALAGFGDARAIEPLTKMAESDANEEVRAGAAEAVKEIKSHIRWRRDIDSAYKEARELKKPVMLFFAVRRSDWCASFEEGVLTDAAVVDAADKYVCVRQNVEGQTALIAKYEIKGVPTVILTDDRGNEAGRLVGFKAKDALLAQMTEAARGRSSFRETRRLALDHPDNAEANWKTAEVYLAEDRLSLAISHLKDVIKSDPQNRRGFTANALFALGFAQGKTGQHKEAVETLRQYLADYPGHKDRDRGRFCLALSCLALGQKNEARQMLENLVKESPSSPMAPAVKAVLEKLDAENK